MAEDQSPIDNMEIEPLSDEDLQGVAGGTEFELSDGGSTPSTSGGPSCCSCSNCSPRS